MMTAIIIPVYNEKRRIGDVLKDLSKLKLPLFVVDDGSKDQTAEVVRDYQRKNPKLYFLRHKINLGKGAALKTGCEAAFSAGASSVVLMDGDGQHDPLDIWKFIDILASKEYDVVFGSRNYNFSIPLIRYLGNKAASVIISLLFGIYVSDSICGFRALTQRAYKKLAWESSGYGIEIEMIIKVSKEKLKYKEIPIKALYYDKTKGVTILDAFSIFFDILKWRISI